MTDTDIQRTIAETLKLKMRAATIAAECSDAYSADRYRDWPGVALALLRRGLDDRQAEAVMRSKWTRWAADMWKGGTDENVPAKAIIAYLDKCETPESIAALTVETFGTGPMR